MYAPHWRYALLCVPFLSACTAPMVLSEGSVPTDNATAVPIAQFAPFAQVPEPAHAFVAYEVEMRLHRPVPGGIAVVRLPGQPQPGQWQYRNAPVLLTAERGQWFAVVGIALKTPTGRQYLQWAGQGQAPALPSFTVSDKVYPSQHIQLSSQQHVNPSAQDLKRYRREHQEQAKAYAQYREQAPQTVYLARPVQGGRYSSPFGVRRFFNGQERNPHSGLDIAVPMGTPVTASADGVVTLVGDYFFNGKTVFVDHGQGLVTMYCHLLAIHVTQGQIVRQGEHLADVGSTGRSTGPHLHWNVSLNNVRIDPAIFVNAFTP